MGRVGQARASGETAILHRLNPVKIPTFPECDHALIRSLIHLSDYDLVVSLQKSPADGKYFAALFCRYSPVVYSLIRHSARSPVQADYLFALTWRHVLNELSGIDLPSLSTAEFSLQAWLIGLTAAHINQAVLPEVADIHYALQDAPPAAVVLHRTRPRQPAAQASPDCANGSNLCLERHPHCCLLTG